MARRSWVGIELHPEPGIERSVARGMVVGLLAVIRECGEVGEVGGAAVDEGLGEDG
jgi:hypothetical protein